MHSNPYLENAQDRDDVKKRRGEVQINPPPPPLVADRFVRRSRPRAAISKPMHQRFPIQTTNNPGLTLFFFRRIGRSRWEINLG